MGATLARLGSVILSLALMVAAPTSACADNYPARPVRIVVPFAAGSSSDGVARLMAEELRSALGGTFIVENKAGANGVLAAIEVARAAPDGHTLLLATNTTHGANPSLYSHLAYDPVRDFTMICNLVLGQNVLAVSPTIPAKTVDDLIRLAKAKPGALSYATHNSSSLVSSELFKALAGVDIVGVPYKNVGDGLNDVIGGRIAMVVVDQLNAGQLLEAGKLRGLAVTSSRRSQMLPDLPTLAEAGLKDFALNSWLAIVGPANIPAEITERLNAVLNVALRKPELVQKLQRFGYEPAGGTPAEFQGFVQEQVALWARLIAIARIKPIN